MNDQRGGIISKLFIIPVGVCLMAGFFFLGYYVGKYQDKTGAQSGIMLPLPDVVSKNLPRSDEFTFYKTLTDKEGKTVSIDLKSGQKNSGVTSETKQAAPVSSKSVTVPLLPREAKPEVRPVKTASLPLTKESTVKTQKAAAKQAPVKAAQSRTTLRYTIQIASYQEKGMAEDEVRNMKKRGYAAFIASADLPGKGMWHRVRLGSFQNKTAAEKLQKDIRAKEGISTLVVIE
jgi:DedD protein